MQASRAPGRRHFASAGLSESLKAEGEILLRASNSRFYGPQSFSHKALRRTEKLGNDGLASAEIKKSGLRARRRERCRTPTIKFAKIFLLKRCASKNLI